MPNSPLPERPSLEYLKKLAKERLLELRRIDPQAQLSAALLAVAREHGASSWRALKAEIEQRRATNVSAFFKACSADDGNGLRDLLAIDPTLVHRVADGAPGWTGLHEAAKFGALEAVWLLLQLGADPNAREAGDNTYPLHWAAARGHVEVVRALLDAGGDVNGFGDLHRLDVIGWATVFHEADGTAQSEAAGRNMVSLLVERGARHHIFSAIAVGDLALIQALVEENPEALDRRMSTFEHGQTPLHVAMDKKRYDILDLLVGLGIDIEAEDQRGHTALTTAMLRGDREATSRLHAAGAKQPAAIAPSSAAASLAGLADSIRKGVPMIHVPDVARALEWYASIGFREINRFADAGVVNFGMVMFGGAELMLTMHGKAGQHDVSLWFYTDKVDDLYQLLKSRQLQAAQAALAGLPPDGRAIDFVEDINDTFYGVREFGIRDLNGYHLYFLQPANPMYLEPARLQQPGQT